MSNPHFLKRAIEAELGEDLSETAIHDQELLEQVLRGEKKRDPLNVIQGLMASTFGDLGGLDEEELYKVTNEVPILSCYLFSFICIPVF